MSSKFVIRLGIWCVLMLYLLCDLVLFDGPLKNQVYRMKGSPAEDLGNDLERGIVARVFAKPVYLSQVDYGVDDLLWRSGRKRKDVGENERLALRKSVLRELCDHSLLREKVALNDKEFPVSEAEIQAAMLRFASRFSNPPELATAMQNFGFEGEKELRSRIAARLQQNKYLDHHIARGIAVTDEEALAWYTAHSKSLTTPACRRVRHIFLAALGHSDENAQRSLKEALDFIQSKTNDFISLCSKLSEDERSKKVGGDLGWLSQHRSPDDFTDAVFALALHQPTIIKTKLGWHLVEVTDSKPAKLGSFEKLKSEVIVALETSRRKDAIAEYRKNLHRQHPDKVLIHESLLKAPWSN
ncbi:MAG: peptidylprolyl isomerase [Rubritalea sp.]|uniref:peptidylprolyl isomerase n=1 Tax=Rubritalea sp. TaxID=2109375 RepID=UPI0032426A34